MDYEIDALDDLDDPEVARLHAELIDADPRASRRYLRWRYGTNPFIGDPIVHVVRLGGRVVAMRGLHGTIWSLGRDQPPIVLPHADDLIIAEDHRNRGLFLLLHRALVRSANARGHAAIIGLSGSPETQELALVCGFRELGDLPKLHKPGRAHRLHRRVVGRITRTAPLAVPHEPMWMAAMFDVVRRVRSSTDQHVHLERAVAPEELAALADRPDDRPGPVRSAEFYRWRLANPGHVYRTLTWRDPHLRGFATLAWYPSSPHAMTIVDHAVEEVSMLDRLLAPLARVGVELYVMTPSDDAEREVFERHGFVPLVDETGWRRRRFLYFPITEAGELGAIAPFPAGWRVSLIDGGWS